MAPRAINLRVDDSLMTLLEEIVAQDKQKILDAGIEADANYSTVIRRLIKAEARRIRESSPQPAQETTPEPPKVETDPCQLEIPTEPLDASMPEPKKNERVVTEQTVRVRLKRALDNKTTTATDFATATGTYTALVARWASGKEAFGDKLETAHAALEALRR